MKLILIGCEYTGTTTLAYAINDWLAKETGTGAHLIHDHWKIPDISGHEPSDTALLLTDGEMDQVMALSPKLKEMTQRYSLSYHTPSEPSDLHRLMIGYHFDDGIYGPLYFDYGGPDDIHDRSALGRSIERVLLMHAPETVLLLVKATPAVIRRRMEQDPHHRGVLQEKDVEFVLERFDYEFKHSLIGQKITLDTSAVNADESLADFAEMVRPHLTDSDRSRMLLNRERLSA